MEKVITLLIDLCNKTKINKAIWNSIDNGFIIKFKGKSYLTLSAYNDNSIFVVNIYNDRGQLIKNIDTESYNDENYIFYKTCLELYNVIHDKYYKVEETIDNILNDLMSTDTKIGDADFNPFKKDDDELPF